MNYYAPQSEKRLSQRLPHMFSFHYKDQVLVGRDICREGMGLFCPDPKEGAFHFRNSESLRQCYIEIHGVTIYFSKLKVMRLVKVNNDFVYGLQIESVLPQEREEYLAIYHQKLEDFENGKRTPVKRSRFL